MKKTVLFLFIFPLMIFAQNSKNTCKTLAKINDLLQQNHYKPKALNDSLSAYVFNTFLSQIDQDNRLFLASEIEKLNQHKYKVDDYITTNNCAFIDDLYIDYQKTIKRYGTIINEIKTEPFLLKSNDSIYFSKKSFPYLETTEKLKKSYKKIMLFDVLKDVAEQSSNKDSLIANFDEIVQKSKQKIFDEYQCKLSDYDISKEDFLILFYETFCSYFDPHTNYFSENKKSDFLSTVSSDNLTFGLYVSYDNKNQLVVDEVMPGSAAFISKKISLGDIIFKIKHNDIELEMSCNTRHQFEEILSTNDCKTAEFTFKKKSGEIYSVILTKELLKNYDNTVYSFILENNNYKTGYINIPSFYTTVENGKSSVSDDVFKELMRLSNQNISDIIIDLQDNGGGSMQEAITLASLFIDKGSIALINDKNNKITTIKDDFKGSIFNGNIIILSNGFSASASEFFITILQDYNRCLIVGSQTYGKATMQRIMPLDQTNKEFVKLTIEHFFRLTGKTNQYIGITPDVAVLPLFDKQMPRESSLKNAVKYNELAKFVAYKPYSFKNKNVFINNSLNRLKNNQDYQNTLKTKQQLDAIYDHDLQPIVLHFDDVYKQVSSIAKLWKDVEISTNKEQNIKIINTFEDKKMLENNDFLQSINKDKIKLIKSNIAVFEATNILKEMFFYH